MTTFPLVPLLALAAAVAAGNSANEVPTDPPLHPHHHKVAEIAGVKGKIRVQWYTLPHNPEQVAKNKRPNYLFNRGYSLKTDVALQCGEIKVPAGNYTLGFQLDGEAKNWSVVLIPQAAAQLQQQLRGARRRGRDTTEIEAKIAGLKKQGVKTMTLPSKAFEGKPAEHLELTLINHGYKIGGRRDPTPISGIDGEFRVSFGDLHTSFRFQEVFKPEEKKSGDKQAGRRRRR